MDAFKEFLAQIADLISKLSFLVDWWKISLLNVDGQPITVGKILLGFILIGSCWYFSRKLSAIIEVKLLKNLGIPEHSVHTLRMIIFYLFVSIMTLFILRLINVPITVFTLLGGALAIGVGFGSQNIVNNFISGLVIMIERPIKVGDLVEIKTENLKGLVKHVGPRSTHIQSLDNTHFVVPNSYFLEKHVLNWTLSDNLIRSSIKVGVCYGSDTDEVRQILKDIIANDSRILPQPEPIVLFESFSESSLDFEAYFWLRIKTIFELNLLSSDLRFEIDKRFRKNKIVIAFPQRDVHLDQKQAIKVKIES